MYLPVHMYTGAAYCRGSGFMYMYMYMHAIIAESGHGFWLGMDERDYEHAVEKRVPVGVLMLPQNVHGGMLDK